MALEAALGVDRLRPAWSTSVVWSMEEASGPVKLAMSPMLIGDRLAAAAGWLRATVVMPASGATTMAMATIMRTPRCLIRTPLAGTGLRTLRSGTTSLLVKDDAADVDSRVHVGVPLVDVLESVVASDQFVEVGAGPDDRARA